MKAGLWSGGNLLGLQTRLKFVQLTEPTSAKRTDQLQRHRTNLLAAQLPDHEHARLAVCSSGAFRWAVYAVWSGQADDGLPRPGQAAGRPEAVELRDAVGKQPLEAVRQQQRHLASEASRPLLNFILLESTGSTDVVPVLSRGGSKAQQVRLAARSWPMGGAHGRRVAVAVHVLHLTCIVQPGVHRGRRC